MVAQETYMGLTENEITIIFKRLGLEGLKMIAETVSKAKDDDKEILTNAYNKALKCCARNESNNNVKPSNVQKRLFNESLKKMNKDGLTFLKDLVLHVQSINKEDKPSYLIDEIGRAEISKQADKKYSEAVRPTAKQDRKARLDTKQKMKVKRLNNEYNHGNWR